MPLDLVAQRHLHAANPVQGDAPLNRALRAWWQVLPRRYGGQRFLDLMGRSPGTLLSMGPSSASSGWGATRRPGGWGELRFDGTNDALSFPGGQLALAAAGRYTWSWWIRPLAFTAFQALWVQLPTVGTTPYLLIYAHDYGSSPWGPVTHGLSVGWEVGGGGGLWQRSVDNVLSAGVWAHVVLTYDGTLAVLSRFRWYVNGADVSGLVESTVAPADMTSTVVRFGADTFGSPFFRGAVDDVRVQARALAPAEVRQLYVAARLRYPTELRWRSPLHLAPLGGYEAAAAPAGTILPQMLMHA